MRGIRFGTMGLPTFHSLGCFVQLCYPLISSQPIGVYTPQDPSPPIMLHPTTMLEVAKQTGCTGLYSIPSAVEVSGRGIVIELAWADSSQGLVPF